MKQTRDAVCCLGASDRLRARGKNVAAVFLDDGGFHEFGDCELQGELGGLLQAEIDDLLAWLLQ